MPSFLKRLHKPLIFGLVLFLFYACGQPAAKDDAPDFLEQVEMLPEYQVMISRIDSLKRQGIRASLSIEVVQESFFPEDSLKNIKLIFLSEDLGFANSQSYIVKYDNTAGKIIEVIDNRPKN